MKQVLDPPEAQINTEIGIYSLTHSSTRSVLFTAGENTIPQSLEVTYKH